MKYIYIITSPSGKQYVGKSTIGTDQKEILYQSASKYFPNIKRPILNAIRKYGWDNMKFEIIEQNDQWTTDELNQQEKYWIKYFNTIEFGYNVTAGGDGHDSESARIFWQNVSDEWKQRRALNCSKGQKQRYSTNPDSDETRERKSKAHQGVYKIESPDGRIWETNLGLKEFAKQHRNETNMSYWSLFNAYRKCYNTQSSVVSRKNINHWKVTRLDKLGNADSNRLLASGKES